MKEYKLYQKLKNIIFQFLQITENATDTMRHFVEKLTSSFSVSYFLNGKFPDISIIS